MNRKACIILILFIFLFTGPSIFMPSSPLPDRQNWPNSTKDFQVSTDGAESPQSITSFSETLDDDTLFYPDGIPSSNTADAGAGVGDIVLGDYVYTHKVDGIDYEVGDESPPNLAIMYLNFTVVEILQDDIDISIYGYAYPDGFGATIDLWNGTGWVTVDDMTVFAYQWANCSVSEDYVISSLVMMRLYAENATENVGINVDYAVLNYEYYTGSSGYAEFFSDISDWSVADTSITSDGDVATITENGAGSTGRAYASMSSTNFFEYYYEFRISTMTASTANLEFWDGAAYNTLRTFTALGTYKGIISDTDAATMQRIGFLVGSNSGNIKPDYLRISPSTETGWQHDGSTTAGVTVLAAATISSDGDKLNISGGAVNILLDTTVTRSKVDTDYYPFLEISITSLSSYWQLYGWDGNGVQTRIQTLIYYGGTFRYNLAAILADDEIDYFRFYTYTSGYAIVDYIKIYSIANYTVTQTDTSSDDVLYVSSSVLYCSGTSFTSIVLDHDPALSVATATYNVWNFTTGSGTPQFDHYVSAWIGYSSETRGELTSGTLTDIRIKFTATANIAAIKFIEDATAPTILDKYSTPANPVPTDAVTISVVAQDAIFIYEVLINAVTYPAGFSDVDYECTEEVSQTVYSYTFSTLTEGYYLFAITVSDGANTDVDYLPVSTSTVPLQISDIVLITATESLAQVSGHSNKDCSYQIYENDTLQGSGSVSTGWFSIAWTKDSTAGAYIELGIKFYVASYTDWVNGSYSVASADVLQITDIIYSGNEGMNTLSGYASLDNTYTVYEEDIQIETGSISAGSFFVDWTRDSTVGTIDWGIKFTDGTTTRWVNGSYYNGATVLQISDTITSQSTSTIQMSGHINLAATYTIYEDSVQTGTGSLTAGSFSLSWTRQSSTTAADVAYAIKFSDGTTTRWVNGTYSKALETAFKVSTWWLDLDLGGQQPMVQGYVLTTWENATITIYDNGTLQITVTEAEGGVFFYWWMSETQGIHNIVLNITNGVSTVTKTRSYFIPDWAVSGLVARYDIYNMQNNYTALQTESNWGNTTVSIYLDSVLMATSGDDPASVSFQRSENIGTFNLTIVWNGGTQIYTISSIYFTVTEEGTTYVSGGFSETFNNYTYGGDTYIEAPVLVSQVTTLISVTGIMIVASILAFAWNESRKEYKRYQRAVRAGG